MEGSTYWSRPERTLAIDQAELLSSRVNDNDAAAVRMGISIAAAMAVGSAVTFVACRPQVLRVVASTFCRNEFKPLVLTKIQAEEQLETFVHRPLSSTPNGADKVALPSFTYDWQKLPLAYDNMVASKSKEAHLFASTRESVVEILGPDSSGSGFIVRSDGLVATASHVLENGKKLSDRVAINLADGTTYDARIVAENTDYDLALLRIEGLDRTLPALPLFRRNVGLKPGNSVYALGYPGSADSLLSRGNTISGMLKKDPTLIYCRLPSYPGFSGSPILTENGRVAAILSGGRFVEQPETCGTAVAHLDVMLKNIGEKLPADGWYQMSTAGARGQIQLMAKHFRPFPTNNIHLFAPAAGTSALAILNQSNKRSSWRG